MTTLRLVLLTLQDESVYGWILAVIGSSITSLRPQNDDNDPKTSEDVDSISSLIQILLGTLFSKFTSHPFADVFTFFLTILPLVYLVFGLMGNYVINTLINFFKKLGKHLTSDDTMTTIMDYLKSFITRKQKDNDGL